MNLNLSKFKKIECNDSCTMLQHPGGHVIKIAHKGLSPEVKSQLDEIPIHKASGGPIAPVSASHQRGAQASKPSKSSNTMPGSPTDASKAYTEPDSMGTSIPKENLQNAKTMPDVVLSALGRTAPPLGPLGSEEKQHYPPCINPSCKSYGHSHPNCRCYGGNPEGGMFAKGGKVESRNFCDDNRAHFKDCEYYAGGGQIGQQQPPQNPPPVQTNQDPQASQIAQQSMRKAFHFANGGDAPETEGEKLDQWAQNMNQASPSDTVVDPDKASGSAPEEETSEAPEDINPNPEIAGAQQLAAPTLNTPQTASSDQGSDESSNDDADRAPASADNSPALSNTQSQALAPQPPSPGEQVAAIKGDHLDHLIGQSQAFNNELQNGTIKPETYKDLFGKKDTLGKIGTIFGMLVSGAGSGLAHQSNALMDMMNNEIKNDLQAQQDSAQNKQNFLKINMQNEMNLATQKQMGAQNQLTQAQAANTEVEAKQKAFALTQVQQRLAALHTLVLNTQKMPEGPAKQQAMQTLAMLNKTVQGENYNVMDQAATASALGSFLGGSGGAGNTMLMKSGALGDEAAKVGQDKEDKTIPGYGVANRAVPQGTRDELQAMDILSNKAQDLMSYAQQHRGTLSPAQRAVAQQKAAEMVNYYNNSIKGGVLTEGRLGWLDDQIKKNPTGIVTQLMGNNARLQEIKSSNDNRRNIILGTYGIKPPKGSPQATPQQASSSSGQTKTMNGVQYQKVSGGWKRLNG